ncbi:hypothetical protein [Nocardia sp. XZ_19_369]|uniref:hypothetical protein n=1 Tax=Nocardia sp. XZ_19_369 TaxID=2769487 RepID=UPI00188F8F36|nr:hypothetical protein [Nocardia sp. XZ_19_369]
MAHAPECDGEIYYCACGFGPCSIEILAPERHTCFDPPRPIVIVNLPVVEMTRDIYERFAGLTASGCLVVDDGGTRTALTKCCNAFATFHDEQLCCKNCWSEVPLEHCLPAEIAVARDLINTCIPGKPLT